MVANGGLTIIYVISLDYFVYIVFLAWEHTFGSTLPSDRNVPFTGFLRISWTVMLKINANSKHLQIKVILSNNSHNNIY